MPRLLAATLAAALLAAPAAALTLRADDVPGAPRAAISGAMVSDGARYGIFRGAGRRVPGHAPGFLGDEVYSAEGAYFGSVDEVYAGPHGARTLVIGLAPGLPGGRFLYVRLPAGTASDGRIVLPGDRAAMARLSR